MTVRVQRLFLTVPWAGLQCVIVVLSDYAHLLSLGRSVQVKMWDVSLFVFHIKYFFGEYLLSLIEIAS